MEVDGHYERRSQEEEDEARDEWRWMDTMRADLREKRMSWEEMGANVSEH